MSLEGSKSAQKAHEASETEEIKFQIGTKEKSVSQQEDIDGISMIFLRAPPAILNCLRSPLYRQHWSLSQPINHTVCALRGSRLAEQGNDVSASKQQQWST